MVSWIVHPSQCIQSPGRQFTQVVPSLGFFLEFPDNEMPCVRLTGIPLPEMCIFHNLTGVPCPGCGLSRSIISALHGDFLLSMNYHRLGLFTLAYILLQFFYHLGMIAIPKKWPHVFGSGRVLNKGIIVLGILFFLNWVIVLVFPNLSFTV